jgi:hypothetical protein
VIRKHSITERLPLIWEVSRTVWTHKRARRDALVLKIQSSANDDLVWYRWIGEIAPQLIRARHFLAQFERNAQAVAA